MEPGRKLFKVVLSPRFLEVMFGVTTRCYKELPGCPACGHADNEDFDKCKEAAYQDGEEFGKMLAEVGSSEYRRGMLDALRRAGYLQSRGTD